MTADWRTANPPRETGAELLARIIAERLTQRPTSKNYQPPIPPSLNPISALPRSWTWARLPQLGDFGRGKSKHRPRNDRKLYGGPYPFVQTGVVSASKGYIIEYEQTYSKFGLAQSKLWPAGTLCITIAANIAKSGVLAFDACFPDSVVGLTCSPGVLPDYINLVISDLQSLLERNAPATAQKNINLDVLEQVPIPLPPTDEQAQIVSVVHECLDAAALLFRDETDNDIGKLRQSVLAAAFRGELL
jgi:type I restriction enzyme S subunit